MQYVLTYDAREYRRVSPRAWDAPSLALHIQYRVDPLLVYVRVGVSVYDIVVVLALLPFRDRYGHERIYQLTLTAHRLRVDRF